MFCFKKLIVLSTLIGLSACDSASIVEPAPELGAANPTNIGQLQQGGFESGFGAWNACGGSTGHSLTTDTPFGKNAAKLTRQSCLFQAIKADPGSAYKMSCQTRRDGIGWGAVMLGFLDAEFKPIDTTEKEITHTNFTETVLQLTAPSGTEYVEVLAYTTGDAELVLDNCKVEPFTDKPTVISNRVADGLTPTVASVRSEQAFGTDPMDVAAGQIDWARSWMVHNDLSFWVAWETHSAVDTALWGLGVYLDTDQNKSTGYRGFKDEYPIGVDYLIEGTSQYRYTGTGNDWSWDLVAQSGTGAHESAAIRSIPLRRFGDVDGIDLFFRADSSAVNGDAVDYFPDNVTNPNAVSTARFYTYDTSENTTPGVVPPVTTMPPVPAVTNGLASIDLRNNLKGNDTWVGSGPGAITLINSGQLALNDVMVTNEQVPECNRSIAALAVGESFTYECGNGEYLGTHVAVVTAQTADGQQVVDSDQTSTRRSFRLAPTSYLVATANKVGITNGDDVTFTVEVANTGNSSASDVRSVTSNVADCERTFEPPLTTLFSTRGRFERYTCVATNVQAPFVANFRSDQGSGFDVNILPVGTQSVNITQRFQGSAIIGTQTLIGTISNDGAEDLLSVQVSNTELPQCDQEYPILKAGQSREYVCPVTSIAGEVVHSEATVAGLTYSGDTVSDTASSVIFNAEDYQLSFQLGPKSGTLLAEPGESLDLNFTLTNIGYIPVQVESVGISHEENADLCPGLFNEMSQANGLSFAPGETKEYTCSVIAPTSLADAQALAFITAEVGYGSIVLGDEFSVVKTTSLKLRKRVPEGFPATATTLINPGISTHPSALGDPVISGDRVIQILANSNFDVIGGDGVPESWVKGCNGTVISTEVDGGSAIRLENDACITYVLNADDLAVLAGREYQLNCHSSNHRQYSSMSVTLNDQVTEVGLSDNYAEMRAIAPDQLNSGFVSLYATEQMDVSDCQLTALSEASQTASIDIRNQAEGIDTYRARGRFDFELAVTNTGSEPLQDVEVNSDQLQCDTNFATLAVAETKTVVCSSTVELTQWDDRFYHQATATAKTAAGVLVGDMDYAGYGVELSTRDYFDVENDKDTIRVGDDVTMTVTVTRGSYGEIRLITSDIPSCNRIIEPALKFGETISFQCTIENIQENTGVNFELIRRDRESPIFRRHFISLSQ